MVDINGQPICEKGLALLLCEVLEIESHQVRIRIMNSEMELAVGAHHDEVLGGMVADSELTAFVENDAPERVQTESEDAGLRISAFE